MPTSSTPYLSQPSAATANALLAREAAVRQLRDPDAPAWLRLTRAVSPIIALGLSIGWHGLPLGVAATLFVGVLLLMLLAAQVLHMYQRLAALTRTVLDLCDARSEVATPQGPIARSPWSGPGAKAALNKSTEVGRRVP